MAALSFVLAIFAIFLTIASMIGAAVEWFGVVAAVCAVLSAIGGIVTGAIAHGRAKREGGDTTFAVVGIVTNVFAFLGAFCIGGLCGSCNYLYSTEGFTRTDYVQGPDGGVLMRVRFPDGGIVYQDVPPGMYAPGTPEPPVAPAAPLDAGVVPVPIAPADPLAPPPAYPPPPIDPGSR